MGKKTHDKSRWAHQKSREELEQALVRQTAHLRRSAQAYDDGVLEEAERLASSIYILVHDGWGKTKSLLGQLGLIAKMRFVDSATPKSPDAYYQSNIMCGFEAGENGWSFIPKCQFGDKEPTRLVKFTEWWSQEVYSTAAGLELTRKNLVFALRMQDGGGHVDDEITDKAYHWLATKGDDRAEVIHPSGNTNVNNGHWATMRQIAWEMDQTLISHGL
ncbi:MAG: hypothetical protein EOO65_01835 [Methanosarcinales archaeon]|nr:MAG: hypothetical protein EOO65_01835 [Methanosarcinales archaeon]